jgi:threonine aldolase
VDPISIGAEFRRRYGQFFYQNTFTAIKFHMELRTVLDFQATDFQIGAHEEPN